ncbi:MAG: hypothetical protein V2B17_05380 [Chloroflexota bacterium]
MEALLVAGVVVVVLVLALALAGGRAARARLRRASDAARRESERLAMSCDEGVVRAEPVSSVG